MLGKLNPFIRFIEKADSNRFAHETAAHDCRLIYVLDGCCDMIIDGKRCHIQENDAVYLPPYTLYALRGSTAATLLAVHFDLTGKYEEYADSLQIISSAELAACARLKQELIAPFDASFTVHALDLRPLTESMQSMIVLPSPYARDRASGLMKEILLLMVEKRENENSISPLTKQIVEYVYAHFADTEVTNQEIATRFGYHPYHISRVMRKDTGKTLKTFIISYRLQVAANMLTLTDVTIADIARACGFESQSYFSKMFREEFATTPGDYRKAHTQRRI